MRSTKTSTDRRWRSERQKVKKYLFAANNQTDTVIGKTLLDRK
jgi:hypothetical protein